MQDGQDYNFIKKNKSLNLLDLHFIKALFRLYRIKLKKIFPKESKVFKNVLYVTVNDIPIDFIKHFRIQYPTYEIFVAIPITKEQIDTKKICSKFKIFMQNKERQVIVCKIRTNENIIVYGFYLKIFNRLQNLDDIKKIQYLAPFLKAVRFYARKINPDVIHAEQIPFFIGAEAEPKFPVSIKVFQVIKDFQQDEKKQEEIFWSLINILNKRELKKICQDKFIQTNLMTLFGDLNKEKKHRIKTYLKLLYRNYYKYKENIVEKNINNEESIIFNRLNTRCQKLFPKYCSKDSIFYTPTNSSIKKCDYWAVYSKTYYNEIFTKEYLVSTKLKELINFSKNKSNYVNIDTTFKYDKLFQNFTLDDFREKRNENKKYLIKELSNDRINTKFVDFSLFNSKKFEIAGYLEKFMDVPLILCKFTDEIYAEGMDIIINTLHYLINKNKLFQFILVVPNGLDNPYVKAILEYLSSLPLLNGRWVYINNKINSAQFYAACDYILLADRFNNIDNTIRTAMKYGCIPVATNKGFYNDIIIDIFQDLKDGNGFKIINSSFNEETMQENYNNVALKALNFYINNPYAKNILVKNAINLEVNQTFDIIKKYYKIYEDLTNKK